MASVRCSLKAEKSYHRQSHHRYRKEEKSRTKGYGQRGEFDFSSSRNNYLNFTIGPVNEGVSQKPSRPGKRPPSQGRKDDRDFAPKYPGSRSNGRYLTQYGENHSRGQNNGRYLTQYGENHSRGQSNGRYLAQHAQAQNDGRYLAQYEDHSMGLNNGRYLTQYGENHSMGQNNGRSLAQARAQNDGRCLARDECLSVGRKNGRNLAQHAQDQNDGRYLVESLEVLDLNQFRRQNYLLNLREANPPELSYSTHKTHCNSKMPIREYKSGDSSCNSESEGDSKGDSESESKGDSEGDSNSDSEDESDSDSDSESDSDSDSDNNRKAYKGRRG